MTLQYCHSGLDPESSLFNLDSRFRGNDSPTSIILEDQVNSLGESLPGVSDPLRRDRP